MDVFLMVRRKKTTIFLDAKETTTVMELKKMIEGITKKSPADQQLYNKEDAVMEDDKSLSDYGLTSTVAKAQQPAEVGLAFRGEDGNSGWEELEKTPYSTPPELPDVMKPGADTAAQEQTVA
jgi:transcription elongation factor B subunit 2